MNNLDKIKNRIPPYLWYKYFYTKPTKLEFNKVQFPIVNRKFS